MAIATLVGAVLCSTGCGGSASKGNISPATLRASVVAPPPASPVAGESWHNDNYQGKPRTTTLAQLRTVLVDPSVAPDLRKLERAHFLRFYSVLWNRPANPHGTVDAESVVNLFRDPEGALAGNDPIRSLSRTDVDSVKATEIPPLNLGNRGWGLHLTGAEEAFVYGFVLRNTVIFVKMVCQPATCAPSEHVRQALGDYATDIARRATH